MCIILRIFQAPHLLRKIGMTPSENKEFEAHFCRQNLRLRWVIFCVYLAALFPLLNFSFANQPVLFCERLLGNPADPRVSLYGSTNYLLRQELPVDYQNRLTEIDSLLGDLEKPGGIKYFFGHGLLKSVYESSYRLMYIGSKELNEWHHPAGENLQTMSHEYGHAVMETNLYLWSQLNRLFVDEYKFLDTKLGLKRQQIQKIEIELQVTENKRKKEFLKLKHLNFTQELHQMEQRKRTLQAYFRVRMSIIEVFADILTVVVTKNPQAMSDLLEDKNSPQNISSSGLLLRRNFEDGDHLEYQNLWKEKSIIDAKLYGDIYAAMLPVRWAFWNLMKDKILNKKKQHKVIPLVAHVLAQNIDFVLSLSPDQIGPVGFKNLEALNEKIIHELEEAISKM